MTASGRVQRSQETLPAQGGKLPSGASGVVLRPCAKQPCGELVEHGRCAKHRAQVDQYRGTSTERGYDSAFRMLRVQCLERDAWACGDCGWRPPLVEEFARLGLPVPRTLLILDELRERKVHNLTHLHADHVISIEERPDLRLVLSNLQTLCNSCHARKTRHETARKGETK